MANLRANLWESVLEIFGKRRLNSLGDGVKAIKKKYGVIGEPHRDMSYEPTRVYKGKDGRELEITTRQWKDHDAFENEAINTYKSGSCIRLQYSKMPNYPTILWKDKNCLTDKTTGITEMSRTTTSGSFYYPNKRKVVEGRTNTFNGYGRSYDYPVMYGGISCLR